MKKAIGLLYLFIAIFLLVSEGWGAPAYAWDYGIDTYSYPGNRILSGTIPGVTYYEKVGVIKNDSSESKVVHVDLYYGSLTGRYQYSPDEGVHWINIDNTVTSWSKSVPAGGKLWIRAIAVTDAGVIYHFLSASPWGVADPKYGEAFYFAFPPTAGYYDRTWTRDIVGYVAVVLP